MPLLSPDLGCPPPRRHSKVRDMLMRGKDDTLVASWKLLLEQLRSEIELTLRAGPAIFPSIHFDDLKNKSRAKDFSCQLRRSGGGVIRGVISESEARTWNSELQAYLAGDDSLASSSAQDPQLYDVYWSPAQVKCRAHPNVLASQKFLMSIWSSSNHTAAISHNYPLSYADRIRYRKSSDSSFLLRPSIEGDSADRWCPDDSREAFTYKKIWEGNWQNYDPWDSTTRIQTPKHSAQNRNSSSMFRMFQGWLPLSPLPEGQGSLRLCPMLQATTAYVLLRPLFSPINSSPTSPEFLSAQNWTLNPPGSSSIPPASSYRQELSNALHPHLQLSKTMVRIPTLNPGDYFVWHCDSIHSIEHTKGAGGGDAAIMYLPVCPLTESNALYLARQRKAFLLGQPGPDLANCGKGESILMDRPGVHEVNEVGGERGLRAMGLLPWDEDDAADDLEEDLLERANNILFPDRYQN
ncbi:unnamed protein product [Clonostachys rhizophaga]|uniref:DUF1479-domain-containing protein n=1 Tax=Clonostachys rhizophaga TaxID=160324 RepID=A0A9N9V075_9HYPO|nr:unnamed protein product [Clonostachys rhizophaga]